VCVDGGGGSDDPATRKVRRRHATTPVVSSHASPAHLHLCHAQLARRPLTLSATCVWILLARTLGDALVVSPWARVATRPDAAVCAHVIWLGKRRSSARVLGIVRRAKARTPSGGGGTQVSSMSWRFTRPRNTSSCVAWGRGGGGGDCAPRYIVASFPFCLSDRLSRPSCPPAWSNLDHRVACSRRYANPWTKPSHVGTANYGVRCTNTHDQGRLVTPDALLRPATVRLRRKAQYLGRHPTYGTSRSQRPYLDLSASASLRAKTNIISHIAYMSSHVACGGPWSSPGSLVLPVSIP
jgi:hypothetical protein